MDMPYPEIKVASKNLETACALFNLYAGEVSEDTSIHNYIFQMMMVEDVEIKKLLKEIAITEMHHLEILGLLIKALGLSPLFVGVSNQKTKWFSGEYVNYERDLKNILLDNIRLEETAIKKYEEVISIANDSNIEHILKRIILDERLHIEIFSKLYQQL